jgi:hypothetical protein
VLSCTPAQQVVLRAMPRPDAFVAAVGAFTPRMLEWEPAICRRLAAEGTLVVDTRDADHEAGDLLQAGLKVAALPHWPMCCAIKRPGRAWPRAPARARAARCSSRAAAGPAGIWPRHAACLPPPGADFHFLNLVFL